MKATGLVLLALAMAGPALADRPRVQPSRDVSVTYRVEGAAVDAIPGGIPGGLRLSWDAAGQRLRAEAEGRTQAVLVDLRAHSAQVIDTGLRSVLPLPVRDSDLAPLTLAGALLTRRGTETIAGLGCTVWAVQSGRGSGTVCLTEDGVALRASGDVDGRAGTFTAVSVRYGALPNDLFRVPPGYMNLGALMNLGRPK